MSHVTNAILVFPLTDDQELVPPDGIHSTVAAINKELGNVGRFVRCDYLTTGKAFESNAYIAAFNHVGVDHLLVTLHNASWEDPAKVQLLLKDEHDDRFTLFDILTLR